MAAQGSKAHIQREKGKKLGRGKGRGGKGREMKRKGREGGKGAERKGGRELGERERS